MKSPYVKNGEATHKLAKFYFPILEKIGGGGGETDCIGPP
jgi:hypothetical protein